MKFFNKNLPLRLAIMGLIRQEIVETWLRQKQGTRRQKLYEKLLVFADKVFLAL